MKRLVVLTVAVIAAFTGALALYLFWVGTLLNRIATNVEDSADLVGKIDDHAKVIRPGVVHINRVGGVVAGALPLLYGMAEQIVRDLAPKPPTPQPAEPNGPSGTRRSRLHDTVGYAPPSSDSAGPNELSVDGICAVPGLDEAAAESEDFAPVSALLVAEPHDDRGDAEVHGEKLEMQPRIVPQGLRPVMPQRLFPADHAAASRHHLVRER